MRTSNIAVHSEPELLTRPPFTDEPGYVLVRDFLPTESCDDAEWLDTFRRDQALRQDSAKPKRVVAIDDDDVPPGKVEPRERPEPSDPHATSTDPLPSDEVDSNFRLSA